MCYFIFKERGNGIYYRPSAASAPLRTRYCVCRISRIIQCIHADNDQIREKSNLMKKAKRIIAAVLVLAMAFVFMALSVSAATCTSCGSGDVTYYTVVDSSTNTTVSGCSDVSGYHVHTNRVLHNHFICRSCGYEFNGSKWNDSICRG